MEKSNFEVYPVSSLIETEQFDNYTCGNQKLDYFTKQGYKELEKNHVTALTSVYCEDNLVGLYALCASESTDTFVDINRQRTFGGGEHISFHSGY
ncbi:hypothetical protein G6R29_00310 [Fructobacillus sp. M2-14]|uniref:Acetyltransferase n=1 Tax=Fructobacillus broussonetiae TaxID=2713173 RepID=A0ABS5QY07_9LACO|nr:hypothetical protein [Fructobacillus broussonetiae]MBS9338079.1 hypothetical protein [Fructobacillus broussonetiae]